MRGDGRMAKDPKKTLLRLLGYMKKYSAVLVVVLICILMTSIAQTTGSRSLGTLVDDYILPMVESGSEDFTPIFQYLTKIAGIFAIGVVGAFLYNYLMVAVSQGTQKVIRDEMFAKMQRLPLRYFDTHPAGDIMSCYTSDVDTLRQMISQAIPQCASSIITLVVITWNLIDTSWLLFIVMLFTISAIVFVTKYLTGKAGKYFIGQQHALGAVNGYIEEMINGQRVVKIFNHEDTCKKQFDELKEEIGRAHV